MNSPRKPNSSYFGPRRRMPTRSRKSEDRFRSKPINKEWQAHQANMKCMNPSKSNHMVYDLRVNVVTEEANTISTNISNVGLSSALVAKNRKSGYVLTSKGASQPTTSRLENSLNPSLDFNCSKPSRNALPLEIPKASASWKSKDDSNTIWRHQEQSHNMKTSRAICSRTHLKAMPNLIHKTKNVSTSNVNNGALGSRWRGQSNSYKEDINVGKEATETLEYLKRREVSGKSMVPVINRMDPNNDEPNKAKGNQDEVVTKEEAMKGHTREGHATCGNLRKQKDTTNVNDAPKKHMQGLGSNTRDNSSHLFGKNHSDHQMDDPLIEANSGATFSSEHVLSCEYRETNLKLPNRVQSVGGHGKTNDLISWRKRPLLEEKASTHVEKDLTCRPLKRRRYIEAQEDEEGNVGDQHPTHIEDVTTELAPQVSILKHCVEQQCCCCSKPIETPRWSGIFKIDGKEYISLAGHLSSKSCEKVRKLSSLPKVVQVIKVPRMTVWPKIFKASKPTGDSIGLYLFPPEMRHDEELYQLLNEVMDKDLILQAVIGEAEMLIFPSVLLPERYQTFQRKPYLWAAFKAKEDKGDAVVEQEGEREKHTLNQLDEVQSEEPDQETIFMRSAMLLDNQQFPAKSIQEVEGCCVQGPNTWLERESPEERRLRDSSHQNVTTAASTAVGNTTTVPTEPTLFTTDNASFHANHGPIRPSMEAPTQSSNVFGIVVRQAPNLEPKVKQFIQEMERKGALVTVMRGDCFGIVVRQAPNLEPKIKQFIQEMEHIGALVTVMRGKAIGRDPWTSNVTTTMQ